MKRALLVLAIAAAVAGFGPSTASAGTECEGLIVCIPVKGPWVQVPGGGTPTYYQLSCPGRGQVIGGLDADRAGPLELSFLGTLGGPVGPGVTTNRSAVFVARTTRSLASFRPLLGCIPASGGGGRARTSYEPKRKLTAAAPGPVVDATIRRVKNLRLKDAPSERATYACLARRAAARVFERRRLPPEQAACAQRARLRSCDAAAGGQPRRRQCALRDHEATGCPRRAADPRDLRPRAELSFATPWLLLGLLLLPLLVLAYRRLERRPSSTPSATRTSMCSRASSAARAPGAATRGLALFLLALATLLVGFARPSMMRLADREEATIVLVIDVSGSMQAEDVPPTRLEAAQRVVRGFLKDLPKRFKVGVVAFSETAEVAAPATDDRQLAIDAIDYLYPQRGTAIGDAIARGVEVARAADTGEGGVARPAAIVLLSDGSQTEGILLPQEGAARAKSFKIPVYAVALGTPEGIVEFNRFGGTRIIPVPPDPATLRQIATSTGGHFYEAENVDDLRDAYDKMGSLVSKVERKQEVTFAFLAGGLVLLLAAAAVAVVTFPRLP